MSKKPKKISAEELDKLFDEGKEDVLQYFDTSKARIEFPVQRINVDIPANILAKVDQEANRIGVTRTSLIKLWIAERVDKLAG